MGKLQSVTGLGSSMLSLILLSSFGQVCHTFAL